jgi:hypothetical protein
VATFAEANYGAKFVPLVQVPHLADLNLLGFQTPFCPATFSIRKHRWAMTNYLEPVVVYLSSGLLLIGAVIIIAYS